MKLVERTRVERCQRLISWVEVKLNMSSSGYCFIAKSISVTSQVGFAELKKTVDDRANIGGTIIGAPIVGQKLAQYMLTGHQDADCRPMSRLILSRQLWACLHRADVPAHIVSLMIALLASDRCLGYYRSTNLWFIKARLILSLSFIYRPLIFDIHALDGPSFIDRSLLPQY